MVVLITVSRTAQGSNKDCSGPQTRFYPVFAVIYSTNDSSWSFLAVYELWGLDMKYMFLSDAKPVGLLPETENRPATSNVVRVQPSVTIPPVAALPEVSAVRTRVAPA